MNVIEMLINEGIAKNGFQAAHIANGLKLAGLPEAEQLKRARLYRDWRNTKIYGKETAPCYEKAIAGEAVPVEPMFEGVLHSDTRPSKSI